MRLINGLYDGKWRVVGKAIIFYFVDNYKLAIRIQMFILFLSKRAKSVGD